MAPVTKMEVAIGLSARPKTSGPPYKVHMTAFLSLTPTFTNTQHTTSLFYTQATKPHDQYTVHQQLTGQYAEEQGKGRLFIHNAPDRHSRAGI